MCSLLPRPFVCECHIISTVPRFQSPPRRTQRADFPLCAHLFASRQGLWDLSCWGDFRLKPPNLVAVEQLQGLVQPLPTPPRPTEALSLPSPHQMAPAYLAPAISRWDEEGLSSYSACPCHRAVAFTPPRWRCRIGQISAPMLPSRYGSRLGPRIYAFRGHIYVYCHYGPATRSLPKGDLVDRLQDFDLSPPCYPNYGAPDFCPAGLPPAEHTSLNWTHFRTAGFPQYGWKAGFSDGAFPTSTPA